uniref:Uncharacterized protein n=1 Tax=Glossina austeni TaxID=7395 RepID=A0A1A9VH06_GLOAU
MPIPTGNRGNGLCNLPPDTFPEGTAAVVVVGVPSLLPSLTGQPATDSSAPVFARKSIPRVRWSTHLVTTNNLRLRVISPIPTSTVILLLPSCDEPSAIRMVWRLASKLNIEDMNPMTSLRMIFLVAPVSTIPVAGSPPTLPEM